jgi:fructosamine-3-kinase
MTSAAEIHYAERMRWLLDVPVTRLGVAGAQHGCQHLTAALADGRAVFAKAAAGAGQAAAFAAEANGLRWLEQARAVPVPRVLGVAEDMLVIELLSPGRPTAEAAAEFGAGLARLHAAGADAFGAPWSGGRGWLIDPAAHGGHRETDLAMLTLFGAPHLDVFLRAYEQVTPLASGWRERVPLHQLHPLLVHVCLFGASYAGQLRAAASGALAGQGMA